MTNTKIYSDSCDFDYDYEIEYDFDCDEHYDAYDFSLKSGGKGGGSSSCAGGVQRVQKRNDNRGGSQGSGNIYSAKHTRLRETRNNVRRDKKCKHLKR